MEAVGIAPASRIPQRNVLYVVTIFSLVDGRKWVGRTRHSGSWSTGGTCWRWLFASRSPRWLGGQADAIVPRSLVSLNPQRRLRIPGVWSPECWNRIARWASMDGSRALRVCSTPAKKAA